MKTLINDGGPAFPAPAGVLHITSQGMTLRDYFAANALGELIRIENKRIVSERDLNDCFSCETEGYSDHAALVAEEAYGIADAMLAAREVKQ